MVGKTRLPGEFRKFVSLLYRFLKPLFVPLPLMMSYRLVIDTGNTATKVSLFSGDEWVRTELFASWTPAEVDALLSKVSVEAAIYSTVAASDPALADYMRSRIARFHQFTSETRLPVTLGYRTPSTLGRDRIAAVVGAMLSVPGQDVLVIDAGTTITYDLLTGDGCFRGGNIAPGIQARLRSLQRETGRLPLVSAEGDVPLLGYDTPTAIRAGVVRGVIYEIEGIVEELSQLYPSLFVFLTGGDALQLSANVKSRIFVDRNLVPKGLNRILYDNV